jgi:hypothetical protein
MRKKQRKIQPICHQKIWMTTQGKKELKIEMKDKKGNQWETKKSLEKGPL